MPISSERHARRHGGAPRQVDARRGRSLSELLARRGCHTPAAPPFFNDEATGNVRSEDGQRQCTRSSDALSGPLSDWCAPSIDDTTIVAVPGSQFPHDKGYKTVGLIRVPVGDGDGVVKLFAVLIGWNAIGTRNSSERGGFVLLSALLLARLRTVICVQTSRRASTTRCRAIGLIQCVLPLISR